MIRLLTRLSRLAFRLALLLALIWLALPLAAQTRLDIPTSRKLVVQLLADTEYRAAHSITSALMTRPAPAPGDALLHARALRGIGQHVPARKLAKQVFSNGTNPKLRYAAAMVVAQALSSDGHKTRAQLWLRRAAEIAPDDARRAQAVRDFRYVRGTNPWTMQARFGITPSDNVNRGPTDNTFVWNGLTFVDPSLIPLSGYEISSGLSIERRITLPSQNRLSFGLVLDDSQYVLSRSAKRKSPTARGSDYSFRAIEGRVGLGWSTANSHWSQNAGLVFGRNWSGGQHLTDYVRAELGSGRAINAKNRVGLRFSTERQWRQDAATRSGDVVTLGARWDHALQGGATLGFDLALSDMNSGSAAIAHQKAKFGLTYAPGQRVLGALASLSLGLETRLYDQPLYGPSPRHDEKLRIGASLFFTEFDLFGFAPKVGFAATRTNSNISRFETEALELSLGLQSVF